MYTCMYKGTTDLTSWHIQIVNPLTETREITSSFSAHLALILLVAHTTDNSRMFSCHWCNHIVYKRLQHINRTPFSPKHTPIELVRHVYTSHKHIRLASLPRSHIYFRVVDTNICTIHLHSQLTINTQSYLLAMKLSACSAVPNLHLFS